MVGWSEYSPIGYLIAASAPSAPSTPQYVSATSSTLSVLVPRVQENGGSPVTSYELLIDDGLGGNFKVISSYNQNPAFTIDSAVETSLISGRIYRVKSRCYNVIGKSPYSD